MRAGDEFFVGTVARVEGAHGTGTLGISAVGRDSPVHCQISRHKFDAAAAARTARPAVSPTMTTPTSESPRRSNIICHERITAL